MKESSLSNNPPCPGRIEPESLIKKTLLSFDAAKSPKNEHAMINIAIKKLREASALVKLYICVIVNVTRKPTKNPLKVLPELIEGTSFFPPIIFPPRKEKVSKSHIVIIISIINLAKTVSVIFKIINIKKAYETIIIKKFNDFLLLPRTFIEESSNNIMVLNKIYTITKSLSLYIIGNSMIGTKMIRDSILNINSLLNRFFKLFTVSSDSLRILV